MQVTLETTEGLERKMTVNVSADKVDQAVDKKLQELKKTVRLDGFRPGKIPTSVIRQRFGNQVRQEVLGDVYQESYTAAIVQEKLRPAGMPSIEPVDLGDAKEIEYIATFEIYPEVKVAGLEKIEAETMSVEIKDEDLDKMIETLRKQRVTWTDVERAAKDEDRVTVNFNGTIDGVEFAGGKGDKIPVVIGQGKMLAEFEKGLVGMKVDDEKDVDVTFPENYQGKAVAGKTAQFKLTVVAVAESALPEIDEEFAKSFNLADGTVEGLMAEIRKNMERELEHKICDGLKGQIMDGLLEQNDIDVPKSLITNEIRNMQQQAAQSMQQDTKNIDFDKIPPGPFEVEASRRVKLGLLMAEIIKDADLKVNDERMDEKIKALASTYDEPAEVVHYYKTNKDARAGLEGLVLEDLAVDYIVEKAKVTTVTKSVDDVMMPTPNPS
ncbi:MAG: trigger factor [Gammaproteobacteria bacterium]|nr:trigger factor [Gammaproteobacteria bacterium]